jgi:hypothetical protein
VPPGHAHPNEILGNIALEKKNLQALVAEDFFQTKEFLMGRLAAMVPEGLLGESEQGFLFCVQRGEEVLQNGGHVKDL